MNNIKVYAPQYYKEFACIASECRHNCCRGGWLIELDDKTLEFYNSLEGEWGEKIRASLMIDEEGDTCFKLVNNQCPHLDARGLCGIYGALGEEHMGVVCKEFPRYTLDLGDFIEKGIGLACEEAARLILFDGSQCDIIELEETRLSEDLEDIETEYVKELIQVRNKIFEIISVEEKSLEDMIKESFKEVLALEDRKDEFIADIKSKDMCELIFDIYNNLEVLEENWKDYSFNIREYLDNSKGVSKDIKEVIVKNKKMFVKLYRYCIYRYFMKAAYDYNPMDKVKFCVTFVIMFALLLIANKKCDKEAIIEISRVFSRQIEYSEENVEVICEEFLFGDEFSVGNLCNILDFD